MDASRFTFGVQAPPTVVISGDPRRHRVRQMSQPLFVENRDGTVDPVNEPPTIRTWCGLDVGGDDVRTVTEPLSCDECTLAW